MTPSEVLLSLVPQIQALEAQAAQAAVLQQQLDAANARIAALEAFLSALRAELQTRIDAIDAVMASG